MEATLRAKLWFFKADRVHKGLKNLLRVQYSSMQLSSVRTLDEINILIAQNYELFFDVPSMKKWKYYHLFTNVLNADTDLWLLPATCKRYIPLENMPDDTLTQHPFRSIFCPIDCHSIKLASLRWSNITLQTSFF